MSSAIVADLTTVIERWYDRWAHAIDAVRASDYTPGRFAIDVTEAWIDATYLCALPYARLGGLKIEITSAATVARFIVTDKTTPMTQVIRVAGGGTVKDNLTKSGGGIILAALYSVTVATDGTTYLYLTLDCPAIDAVPTAAGVYEGFVKNASGDQIARIEVVWPG